MPETTTTTTPQLPTYLEPYVPPMLAQTQALTAVPKDPYTGQRVAGFTDTQTQAMTNAQGLGPSGQLGMGSNLAASAGIAGLATNYNPTAYGSAYRSPTGYGAQTTGNQFQNTQGGYNGTQFGNQFQSPGSTGYNAVGTQAAQASGPMMVGSDSFLRPGTASAYMSPYMQNVVDIQQREADRQADIATTGRNAQAVQRGAFGGSRQAVMDAEASRNLATQKGDIQATGLQQSYQQAQQQFNAEQARDLQGQQSNQGAWLQTILANAGYGQQANLANQNAFNQSGQFNAGQGLQAAGMGAQYGQAANQLNAQQQQYGYGQGAQADQMRAQYGLAGSQLSQADRQYAAQRGMSDAQYAAQYGLAGQQLGQADTQFGASLGMLGINAANTSANVLNTLGKTQFDQETDANKLNYGYGTLQQGLQQKGLDTQYADFLTQQNDPYTRLAFQSDMLHGLPMQQSTQSSSSTESNSDDWLKGIAGIGSWFFKNGGPVRFAEGGIVSLANGGDVGLMAQLSQIKDPKLLTQIIAANQGTPLGALAAKTLKDLMHYANAKKAAQGAQQTPDPMDQGLGALEANSVPEMMAEGGIVPRYNGQGPSVVTRVPEEEDTRSFAERGLGALKNLFSSAPPTGEQAALAAARAARQAEEEQQQAEGMAPSSNPLDLGRGARGGKSIAEYYKETPPVVPGSVSQRSNPGAIPEGFSKVRGPAPAKPTGIAALRSSQGHDNSAFRMNPVEDKVQEAQRKAGAMRPAQATAILQAAPTQSYLQRMENVLKSLGDDPDEKELKAAYAKRDAALDKSIAELEDDPKFMGLSKRTLRAALASIGASQGTFAQALGGSGAAVQTAKKEHDAKLQGLRDKKENAGIAGIVRKQDRRDKAEGRADKIVQHELAAETAEKRAMEEAVRNGDMKRLAELTIEQRDRIAKMEAENRVRVANIQASRGGGAGGTDAKTKPLKVGTKEYADVHEKVSKAVSEDLAFSLKPQPVKDAEIERRMQKLVAGGGATAGAAPAGLKFLGFEK